MFIKKYCNWTEFRQLPGVRVVDLHFAGMPATGNYWENMAEVKETKNFQAMKPVFFVFHM